MTFNPAGSEAAGILLYKDEGHQYFLKVCLDGDKRTATVEKIGQEPEILGTITLEGKPSDPIELTVKSDDVTGRSKTYEAIVKGDPMPPAGIPESLNVLLHELRGLGLKVTLD